MTTPISSREWEALSAYLDNQLNARERARLEKRLREDASLRSALDGLRRTRQFLRKQPQMRAPRSFALSPEMAGFRDEVHHGAPQAARRPVRPTPPAYPALRLAFALATFFFVIVFFGDLAAHRLQPAGAVVVQRKEAMAPEAPVQGFGGGGGGGAMEGQSLPQPAPAEVFAAPPTEAAAVEKAFAAPSEEPDAQVLVVTPENLSDLATSAPVLGAAPQEQPPMALQAAQNEAPVEEPERQASPVAASSDPGWSFLRILQVLLGLLALISGLAILYLRRTGRV